MSAFVTAAAEATCPRASTATLYSPDAAAVWDGCE